MDPRSINRQKKLVTVAALAGGALFILVPLLTVWPSPYNARAATDETAPAALVQGQGQGQGNNAGGAVNAAPVADANAAPADATNAANTQVGGAVTGFWSLAWSKAWPPVRDILTKLWGVTKGVFVALWNVAKDIGNVNADINAAVNTPINAAP